MRETSRERVLAILRGDGGGEVAYDALRQPAVTEVIEGLPLPPDWLRYFRDGDVGYVILWPAAGERDRFGAYVPELPPAAELSCWGVGRLALRTAEGYHAGHRYWHPLARVDTVDGLASYPFPDLCHNTSPEALRTEVTAMRDAGFAVVGQMSQTILETAYLMRGMDELFVDFHQRPEYVHALFAALAERRVRQARMLAAAGVDVLRIGDDIGAQESLMVSLGTYREFIRPYHAAVIAAARDVMPDLPVLYHSDGRITDLLPDLVEIGVTAINPVQPECMDLGETQRDFGNRLSLWGCTPVQSLYAHGVPRAVRRHTRFLLDRLARARGLVVQFTNIIITPNVLRNLRCFFMEFADLQHH
ncbi:MAG: hypothetical protein JXR77_06630 [Lentisphaeria bacterium]|nr:hypothetical protein [Lentisphaeria bacterium]